MFMLAMYYQVWFYNIFLQRDKSPEATDTTPPTLEICGNPSLFTVYSTVRQSILEQCMKEATKIYNQSQSLPSDSDSDEEREEKSKEATIKLPKVRFVT